MDCKTAKEMIPLYMDDMLEEKKMQEVVVHLLLCSDCKGVHNDLIQISKELQDAEPVIIPKSFKWKIPEEERITDVSQAIIGDKNKEKNKDKNKEKNKEETNRSRVFNWRTFSAIAAILVISLALSSEMIDFGASSPDEAGEVMTMTRMENHDEEMLWEDVKSPEDEENYYIGLIENQLGQEFLIDETIKDAEDIWHFTIIINDIIYKYEGKGGEIWTVE